MIPTYDSVPDHWKHPIGPYRKAPDEYGGKWWLVNPFTTTEPWKTQGLMDPYDSSAGFITPPGFEEIFGKEPVARDFMNYRDFQIARGQYLQDLKHFKRAGTPDWFAETQLDENADMVFQAWGMGRPMYYEGRYGWMGRFPHSEIKDFEAPVWSVLNGAHQLIAGYQMRLIEMGKIPPKRHPFVPPHVWPQVKAEEGLVGGQSMPGSFSSTGSSAMSEPILDWKG